MALDRSCAQSGMASPLELVVKLTPERLCRRHSRISGPLIESPQVQAPVRRQRPLQPDTSAQNLPESAQALPENDAAAAALEFEDFSFLGADGSVSSGNVSKEQLYDFHTYMVENYNVVETWECGKFLVLGCETPVPHESRRPFSIGGFIAIWRPVEDLMRFRPLVGEYGGSEPVKIDEVILDQIAPNKVPPKEVFLYLANNAFPDCEAISFMDETLVVELPERSTDDFIEILKSLPDRLERCSVDLRFHNGPLPNAARRTRAVIPTPKVLENMKCDESDYVSLDGRFYPGVMINSTNKEGGVVSSATAGVLVEKGSEQRLTCSFHNWKGHYDKHPSAFGSHDDSSRRIFEALQGDPGTVVGYVSERVGNTDLALAKLDDGIVFENQFMEMDFSAKTLIPSSAINPLADEFLMDSFSTGRQRLRAFGVRYVLGRNRGGRAPGHEDLLPLDGAYISLEQGVYATNSPIITAEPQIRDRVCGAVLLRCRDSSNRQLSDEEVLDRGEICGIVHFADLQTKYAEGASFLVYADAFDPLIEAEWRIAKPSPADDQGDAKPDREEPPSKRRRV